MPPAANRSKKKDQWEHRIILNEPIIYDDIEPLTMQIGQSAPQVGQKSYWPIKWPDSPPESVKISGWLVLQVANL